MKKGLRHQLVLVLALVFLLIYPSEQLQSSQASTLLRIQLLLNYPPVLRGWNNFTDFCDSESNPSLTVECYEESITQLIIIGNKGCPPLPRSFSIDSFVTTLVKLLNLKVLKLVSLGLWGPLPGKIVRLSSLEIFDISSNYFYGAIPQEISSLSGLHTFVLDDNMFGGNLPKWLDILSDLTVLSLKKNTFNGSLPESLSKLTNLRVLALSHNQFYGKVPVLSGLINLQELDLEDNAFGPQFPKLSNKLVTLVLSKNRFRSGIPAEMKSYYQLERIDLSHNSFVGPFPTWLLSLPSITDLNIAGNKFTGMLFNNMSCNADIKSVDLSLNLLTGSLPSCLLSNTRDRVVRYAQNCLSTGEQHQHPLSFCCKEALAVGNLPQQKDNQVSKLALALGISGGIVGAILLASLIFLFTRRLNAKRSIKSPPIRYISENASAGYTSKLLSDARYISQTTKLGALGLPAYRSFSIEELEEATNNFDTSTFIGEGSFGQIYRGQLNDGSIVSIRCLQINKNHSTQYLMHHIELISKLRHRNLVSALGHCFDCYLDDSRVSRVLFIFEYVANGTLRSWISDGHAKKILTWTQRISVAIGVAKGIQFLHTGIVPGMYSNNLKITDILLDQNLVAKINSYNLPLLADNTGKNGHGASSGGLREHGVNEREKQGGESDVYDFGVILLEVILGRPTKSKNQVNILKKQIEACIITDDGARRSMVDSAVRTTCVDQSLKTMMEICVRCLAKNPAGRPSVEDVLWNLQFAAQVQEAWHDSQSSEGSPVSPSQASPPSTLRLTIH